MRAPWSVACALVLLTTSLAGCLLGGDDVDLGGPSLDGLQELAGRFREPVDLLCGTDLRNTVEDTVHRRSCQGFAEPVMEIGGDGRVWVSVTCCVGRSPPIWTSTDDAHTFDLMPFAQGTGIVRDATGIEGDFAIDDAGNVYFFDILAATAYITKFDKDGNHVHTKPDAFRPPVDRPWIRAGAENEVYIFYNTGPTTEFLRSFDGGLTWDYANEVSFEGGLMTFGQGPDRDRLFVTGSHSPVVDVFGTGSASLWITEDKGSTWTAPIRLPAPLDEWDDRERRMADNYMPVTSDAVGNIYVTGTWQNQTGDVRIFLHIFDTNGTVRGPFDVSGPGWHEKPWPATGDDGHVAISWYGTNGTIPQDASETQDQPWYLMAAYTDRALDSRTGTMNQTWHTVHADPEPVLENGLFGRRLGDFLQSDIAPNGKFHIAYAKEGGADLQNRIVVLEDFDLGPGVPRNGPFA